jgi:hypothetical protein
VPPLSHLTSCTPTKFNLHFESSFATAMNEPGLYRLLTFQVPHLMSILLSLGRLYKEAVLVTFRNKLFFYGEVLLAPHPTPKLEAHPLSAVLDYLFNIFAAILHIWRLCPPPST